MLGIASMGSGATTSTTVALQPKASSADEEAYPRFDVRKGALTSVWATTSTSVKSKTLHVHEGEAVREGVQVIVGVVPGQFQELQPDLGIVPGVLVNTPVTSACSDAQSSNKDAPLDKDFQ